MANQINVLLDPTKMPNQSQDQATFDSLWAGVLAALPTFGAQLNAAIAAFNVAAAGSAYAIPYTVDLSSTADTDPGPGTLRFGSATQNASTVLRLDVLNALSTDVTAMLDTFDASTNPVKGTIRVVKQGDATTYLMFNVTARTAPSGYRDISVTPVASSSNNPFGPGDAVLLHFTRAGDKGDPGTLTQVLWVRDEKVSGSAAGDSVAGATVQRTLNTIKRNTITGASLSSNQVTLPAGTYRISFTAPAYCAGAHKAWLYNVTDGAVLLAGTSDYSGGAGSASASSRSGAINCEIVLAASKVLEVRHYTFATSSPGLGFASSSGQAEVYTELFVEKVA
jgi:hypothetical protein